MSNPIGFDGAPMERHHRGRCPGRTELIEHTTHRLIHEGENTVIREIMRQEALKGNPNAWTAKRIRDGI